MASLVKKANGTTPAFEDPFTAFNAMRRAMMHSFFEPIVAPELAGEMVPAINLYEKDGTYVVECALPGYKKDDITIEASGDTLTITGTYSSEKAEEKPHYHRREMRHGSFARTIALPQEVDAEKIAATFENGLLKVTLPAAKAIKAKSIPITG